VKVVNSSVRIIPIPDLASGTHYQVHVESLSVSGVARSKSKSFKTEHESGHQQLSTIFITLAVLLVSVSIVIAIVALVKNRRYVITCYFAQFALKYSAVQCSAVQCSLMNLIFV